MRKNLSRLIALMAIILLSLSINAQNYAALQQGAMAMTSKSKQAKQFTAMGLNHIQNAEFAAAYEDFLAAVNADPNLTTSLSLMAYLSTGETKKNYAKRAAESAINKTESEKIMAATVDEQNNTPEKQAELYAKLKTLNPNDRVLGHFYVITRTTPEQRLQAALEYNKQYPEEPAMYNMLGYYYMQNKDFDKAKTYFEKYIQLYPDGYNPYDSMGEFYLNTGDLANSEKYYKMSLEKYPFNNSSLEALKKIADQKKTQEQKN